MTTNKSSILDMTDQRPHLINMFYSWFSENNVRTFLVVDTQHIESTSPLSGVAENGEITLSIGMSPCPDFQIKDGVITLSLRFKGVENFLTFPIHACRMIFSPDKNIGSPLYVKEDVENTLRSVSNKEATPTPKSRPKLSLVH